MTETTFAQRMREARTALGLSQTELGAQTTLEKITILRIEGGKRHIRLNEAIAIAHALDLPLERMLSDQPLTYTIARIHD